jgi:hypothetical protein
MQACHATGRLLRRNRNRLNGTLEPIFLAFEVLQIAPAVIPLRAATGIHTLS